MHSNSLYTQEPEVLPHHISDADDSPGFKHFAIERYNPAMLADADDNPHFREFALERYDPELLNNSMNDGIIELLKGKPSCANQKASNESVMSVVKAANYNSGGNNYNNTEVRQTLDAFYIITCEGWGYAPGTKDEQTVVNEVARRAKVDPKKVQVFLYTLYYANQRGEIFDYPKAGVATDVKPYVAPSEGGGDWWDQVKAGFSSPIVWGGGLLIVSAFVAWKFLPAKKGKTA